MKSYIRFKIFLKFQAEFCFDISITCSLKLLKYYKANVYYAVFKIPIDLTAAA